MLQEIYKVIDILQYARTSRDLDTFTTLVLNDFARRTEAGKGKIYFDPISLEAGLEYNELLATKFKESDKISPKLGQQVHYPRTPLTSIQMEEMLKDYAAGSMMVNNYTPPESLKLSVTSLQGTVWPLGYISGM